MAFLLILLYAVFWIAVIGGGFYLAVRALRAFEGRGSVASRADPLALAERVRRLEETIESMGVEMERLTEGQQFTQQLLTERRTPARGTPALSAPPATPTGPTGPTAPDAPAAPAAPPPSAATGTDDAAPPA